MEKYEEPIIEIIPFEAEDIICISGCADPAGDETELIQIGG